MIDSFDDGYRSIPIALARRAVYSLSSDVTRRAAFSSSPLLMIVVILVLGYLVNEEQTRGATSTILIHPLRLFLRKHKISPHRQLRPTNHIVA
jgi:hypothetical protein